MKTELQREVPNILVVDDDPGIRILARAALEREGMAVAEAAGGEAALSVLACRKPDLILLDVMMPDVDGFSVCGQVRRLPGGERLPVCMMTGLDDTPSIHRAYQAGATDFITKPINWLLLGYRLRYLLRASRALDEVWRAEAKSRALLGAIPDWMLRISRTGTVLESRRATDAGIAPVQERSATVFEIMPAHVAEQLLHQVGQALGSGGVQVLECAQALDGKRIEWEIRTVRSGEDEALSIVRDITERKRTEQALKASEERYALASLAANDGLWDWDLVRNEFHFSPRWKLLLGYADEEIGTGIEEWFGRIHPQDGAQVKVELNSHLEGLSAHFENEHRMLHKDGEYRWMLSRGIAVRDGTGRIYRMAGSQTDVSARKRAEEQLLHGAFYDALTGLPNRALFMDRLGSTLRRTRREAGCSCAVFFLDLDRFKVINDSLGHAVGDAVLVETARRLESFVRQSDTVARLGGDEFVMLFENVRDVESARVVAERIRQALAVPFRGEGAEIFSTASIGIALGSAAYDSAEDLVRDADITMYQAKALGRGRWELFDPGMRQQAVAHLHLETDLRSALEREELRIHYQPIVTIADGRINGLEALLRWQHPRRGCLAPGDFVPLAEETGLIVPIGAWVLRTACAQLRAWEDEGVESLRMTVNISAVQLRNPGFADLVTAVIAETGIAPDCLELEFPETILMGHSRAAVDELVKLRAAGVHISIDDFGTGYSSLNYLQSFPIDTLKIDRSFISKLAANGEHEKIVATMLLLGDNLGLDVVAEGIETAEQLTKLRMINCRRGQGFFFSKPMEGGAVRPLLPEGRRRPRLAEDGVSSRV